MLSSLGGPGRLLNFDERMKSPSLGLVMGFWFISNVLVIAWWWADISDRFLPGVLRYAGIAFFVSAALAPLVLLFKVRRSFFNPVVLGLLVCCCLALSITAHEANLLRERLQFSLDHEREFAHIDAVEGVIRPLIARITEVYVQILGDDHTRGGSTFHTHIVANYMFDSLSFLAVFALATLLLSPTASWLCLLTFAFYTQIAIYPGRMGPVFIAGGLFWQLFLLVSRQYPAAIISGLIISFGRTDVVFASAFVLLSLAAFERRWPTPKEWGLFGLLVGISIAVPKILIWMHPGTDFRSFLITHGGLFLQTRRQSAHHEACSGDRQPRPRDRDCEDVRADADDGRRPSGRSGPCGDRFCDRRLFRDATDHTCADCACFCGQRRARKTVGNRRCGPGCDDHPGRIAGRRALKAWASQDVRSVRN
ncbi:hypothetical protein [Bradyrhizobium diazoefficiens]